MKSGVVGMQLRTLAGSLFLILATSLFSLGQSGTTGISGIVSDSAGAAVPGATITLVDPATGFSRATTTNSDGKYNFPGLQPATYRLEVTAANFKKLVNSNVKALVDTPIVINPVL